MAVPLSQKDHLLVIHTSQESKLPKIAKHTAMCRAGSSESGAEARPRQASCQIGLLSTLKPQTPALGVVTEEAGEPV